MGRGEPVTWSEAVEGESTQSAILLAQRSEINWLHLFFPFKFAGSAVGEEKSRGVSRGQAQS